MAATRSDLHELGESRPVLPWRLVAGVLIHFVVPAYLVALGVAWLIAGAPTAELLRLALRVSGWFVAGYAALTLAAALVARLLDPALRRRRTRREATDPEFAARQSAARVAHATAQAVPLAEGPRVAALLVALRTGAWDHHDARDQKLSADLSAAIQAFATAQARATPERRGELARLTQGALERVATALAELADERGRLAEGDARTHARYLDARYGPALDLAGPAPD